MAIIKPYNGIYPRISESAFVADNATIIGDVEIEDNASIWYGCVVRGDVSHIKIGMGTNIQDNSTIHVSRYEGPTIIGKGVTIGHMVMLHACTLDDYSFVGMGSTLLDRSNVQTNGMVAAGSLLTSHKIVKSGELWAGSPAKMMRMMKLEEIDYINTSCNNYIKLASEHKNMLF